MSINNAEIRLLLGIWDLGNGQGEVNKGAVLPSFSGKDKEIKKAEYKGALQSLIDGGAIAVSKKYALTDVGLQRLAEGLRSPDFSFQAASVVSSRLADAALRWFQKNSGEVAGVESAPKISSYDEFKAVALETYDQLNRDYNYDNFVPIYKIRRSIGDRLTRTEFNDWLVKMQADSLLLLQENAVEDNARDKLEDSVSTPINGLRCYATKKVK